MLLDCVYLKALSSGSGATNKIRARFVFLFPSLPMFSLSRWTTLAVFYLDTLIWRQFNLFWLKNLKWKSQSRAETRHRFHHSWPIIKLVVVVVFFQSATLENCVLSHSRYFNSSFESCWHCCVTVHVFSDMKLSSSSIYSSILPLLTNKV